MLPSSYNETVVTCSPVVTKSCNFAVKFVDFYFKAGFTLSSGELKFRNSYLSPDAAAPRRPKELLVLF